MRLSPSPVILIAILLAGCAGSAPNAGNRPLTAALRLRLAKAEQVDGNTSEALTILAGTAARWPDNANVQISYARALLRAGKVMAARDVVMHASARRPEDRALSREAGVVDIDAGNEHLGLDVFNRLLATDPRDWKTMVDKGVALDIAHRHQVAQHLYCRAMTMSPRAPGIATDYAMSLMLQGRLVAARKVLDPYFVRYDTPTKTRADLAVLYQATGQINRVDQLVTSASHRRQVAAIALRLPAASETDPGVVCSVHAG